MGYTAIFGGTFNPLHIGHYEILSALQNDADVDEIFLMPDKIPPHKVCDFLADDQTRIEMCKIAVTDFSKAKVCLIEFERQGKSYSYDTIIELKAKYPEKKFAFVCGGDMLVTFDLWYKYEELIKLIPFIAFKIMDQIITNIASSKIRIDFNNSKEFIPEKIFDFLKDRGIYGE